MSEIYSSVNPTNPPLANPDGAILVEVKQAEVYEPLGLEDGGHVVIECSACGAPLVDLWVTRPKENKLWVFKVKCPHCGDHSFLTKIKGGLHMGATEYTIPGAPEECPKYVLIHTEKLAEYNK